MKEDLKNKLWNEFLERCGFCHADSVGNRPCDNGTVCDMCMTDSAKQWFEEFAKAYLNQVVLIFELDTMLNKSIEEKVFNCYQESVDLDYIEHLISKFLKDKGKINPVIKIRPLYVYVLNKMKLKATYRFDINKKKFYKGNVGGV